VTAHASRPSSELLEHTAEAKVRVRAPSFGELAAEAGRALARIQLGRAPTPPTGAWRTIEVHSTDREALLVDWLNELIFLAETERWVPAEFQVVGDTGSMLRVLARGVSVEEAPARVKAATFSGLHIRRIPGGLEAEVVFDV
jgi:SHS2 domain-containing protein